MLTAQKTNFGFVVINDAQRLVKTTIAANGQATQEEVSIPGLTPERFPVLAVAYQGNNSCDCDCAAGVQRWHGPKSVQVVSKALRKMGLDYEKLMAHARKVKGGLAPRFW